MSKYVALTGAAGFIGRVVCRQLLEAGHKVYAIDSLTYAADPECLPKLDREFPGQLCIITNDIRHLGRWPDISAVIHLAASTHVDNSLTEGTEFFETNVNGTLHLLEMTRRRSQHGMPHFVHVSTDEIYGEVLEGTATTDYPMRPRSPYAASKAAADLAVQAWGTTYGLPYTIIRPSNAYGCGQYPEKFIPRSVRRLMLGEPIQIHGDGSQTRQWLAVEDCASAIVFALENHAKLPPLLNIAGNTEATIKAVARRIVEAFPDIDGPTWPIEDGYVRPACDQRYSVCDAPLREAGWEPKGDFWRDLPEIVQQEAKSFRF